MCLISYNYLKNIYDKYYYKYYLIEYKKKDKNTQTVCNEIYFIEEYDIINNKDIVIDMN